MGFAEDQVVKRRAKIESALTLQDGEDVVEVVDAIRGKDFSLLLLVAVVVPFIALAGMGGGVLRAAVIGGAAGALGGLAAVLIIPRSWIVLTDRRVLVLSKARFADKPVGVEVDTFRGDVRVVRTATKAAKTRCAVHLPDGGERPYTVGKAWVPALDRTIAALA